MTPPRNLWDLFLFEKGAVHPKDLYGPDWLTHLNMASVMVLLGFGRLCCEYDLTPDDLASYSKKIVVPKEWRKAIRSKLWDEKLSRTQIANAVNENPMVLVKALMCLLLLAAVIKKNAKKDASKSLQRHDVWSYVRIKAILFRVHGPKGWLAHLKANGHDSVDLLHKKFDALGFFQDWRVNFEDLLRHIGEGHCVTFEIATAVRNTLGGNGLHLTIELARRGRGNLKSATPLLRFISPPLNSTDEHS